MINLLTESDDLLWDHLVGGDKFDYPIDYWGALLDITDDGHVYMLYRWEPNHYCHFHRHTATTTTSVVLSGELEVIDYDLTTGEKMGSRVRTKGDYACKGADHVHMEKAGPEGALVFYHIHSEDGNLAQVITSTGEVLVNTTVESLRERYQELAKSNAA